MKNFDVHDLIALVAVLGVLTLAAVGKLDPTAALTFIGGLALRSPIDRPDPDPEPAGADGGS